ncbi:MAG: hypothetical protein HYV67_04035 [Candidatus Taylorbacteria bacterium]|nr:hypothetical protein [Candidatus Taylorbacteria bacterium]
MKYYELDKEEKELLETIERGSFKSVPNVKKEMERYRSYARGSSNRSKNINIRLAERDLHKLKVKAAEKGLPYQTLVASILHQYNEQ